MRKQPNRSPLKIEFSCLGQRIHLNLILVLALMVLEYLLIHLGLWQLDRAEEKKKMQSQLQVQRAKPPIDISKGLTTVTDYQNVFFDGQPIAKLTVFVANESHQGQDGYHVLNLVELDNQRAVWVNRGWVKALADRRYLPEVSPLPERWMAIGVAYFDKGEPILFEHALQQASQDQWLMQGLSFTLLSKINATRNVTVLPYIIRLAPEASHGFIRDWHWLSMLPEKHLAYAIQWFGLALALLLLGAFVSIKKQQTKTE
jgi:surfeit locus 1 family protein